MKKMTTAMLTAILLLAAGRAEAQSTDAAIDAKSDVTATRDAGTDAKNSGPDASVSVGGAGGSAGAGGAGGAGGAKGGVSTDAAPAPAVPLFLNDKPGCAFGGAPGHDRSTLIAAGLAAFAIVDRRRRAS
jgi:hypothetical protein